MGLPLLPQWVIYTFMQTVIETPQFIKAADKIMSAGERTELINFLAAFPTSGDEIVGTGGVRKLRFASGNKGKSGSVRVIYYVYDNNNPIYALTCFGKSNKGNLSKSEINELKKLTTLLKGIFKGKAK